MLHSAPPHLWARPRVHAKMLATGLVLVGLPFWCSRQWRVTVPGGRRGAGGRRAGGGGHASGSGPWAAGGTCPCTARIS
jgi:hypothetical protein